MIIKNKIHLLILIFAVNAFGQNTTRRALFLHGFGSDETAWTDGTKTENTPSGTPDYLVSEGIIDDYANPSLPSFTNEIAVASVLENQTGNYPNDEWIIVGHSLGGLIARKAAPLYTNGNNADLTDINLKGVLTFGTPHQGAPVADLQGNNAQATIDAFRDAVKAAPEWEANWGASLFAAVVTTISPPINLFAEALFLNLNNIVRKVYEIFAYYLNDLHNTISIMITDAEGNDAGALIPGSAQLQNLNNLSLTPLPGNYLSISGVENTPSVVRIASKLGFSGDKNETEVVNLYEGVKTVYSGFYNAYKIAKYAALAKAAYYSIIQSWAKAFAFSASAIYFNQGQQKWKGSYNKIKKIDTIWAGLHNGDILTVNGTRQQRYWADCGTGSPPGGWNLNGSVEELELLFDLPGCSDPDAIAIGGFWAYRLVSYTTHVADKSDGFIPVNRTRWNATDGYPTQGNTNSNGANVVSGNIYFDGNDEADGGYNHSELRNLTRNYGQHGISKPMDYGRQWIIERLGLLP